jgi:hypothetical protein
LAGAWLYAVGIEVVLATGEFCHGPLD